MKPPWNPGWGRGETHGSAKLTEADVRAIRQAHYRQGTGCTALGERYGVSRVAIWYVVNHCTWGHVT